MRDNLVLIDRLARNHRRSLLLCHHFRRDFQSGRLYEVFSSVFKREQRLYFVAQSFVARASFCEEGGAFPCAALQRVVVDLLDLLPPLSVHIKTVTSNK